MFISLQKHSCEIIMRCVMNFQQRTDDNLSLEYFNLKDKNTIISNIPSSSYPCHLRISKRVEPLLCTSHPFQSWSIKWSLIMIKWKKNTFGTFPKSNWKIVETEAGVF